MKRLIFMLSVLFLQPVLAGEAQDDISDFTLDNGLRVYVLEDHRTPLAWFQIWYNVGSSDEVNGLTGISHALEHMMFKGTSKYGPGKIWQIVSEDGGMQNAFTSNDYTCYWQQLPANKIETSFDIESDRMQNLVLTEPDFKKERQVILEERRMRTEDNPNGLAYEQFTAALKLATPYQDPVIGWQRDINNITVGDMLAWYEKWYTPKNAVIVVAGDVKPSNVYALATKYFGNIKSHSIAPRPNLSPVPQLGKKILDINVDAKVPSFYLGFQTPSLRTIAKDKKNEVYALALLDQVITGGDSSILERELVRKTRIADSLASYYDPFSKYDGKFMFYGVPAAKESSSSLEKALLVQIDGLKHNLIPEDQLNRAKAQLLVGELFAKEAPNDRAMNIGSIVSIGLSPSEYNSFFTEIQQVTAPQIKAVVKKYFNSKNYVVAYVKPQK
ncbi:MAG: insulinase family protein [Legionellales bacterium]|nr:insulinase family protein [Legionellales bacterium]